jgi:hypothetical protein
MAHAGMNPQIADEVPWSETLTAYDEAHYVVAREESISR